MARFQLIHLNSLACEIGRYEIPADDHGEPLTLAAVHDNADLRSGLDVLQPGDRLELIELDTLL